MPPFSTGPIQGPRRKPDAAPFETGAGMNVHGFTSASGDTARDGAVMPQDGRPPPDSASIRRRRSNRQGPGQDQTAQEHRGLRPLSRWPECAVDPPLQPRLTVPPSPIPMALTIPERDHDTRLRRRTRRRLLIRTLTPTTGRMLRSDVPPQELIDFSADDYLEPAQGPQRPLAGATNRDFVPPPCGPQSLRGGPERVIVSHLCWLGSRPDIYRYTERPIGPGRQLELCRPPICVCRPVLDG
jgi:hypothetical protein